MTKKTVLKITRTAILAGGLLALLGAAQADTPAQVRQAIQAVCDHTAAAYAHRDLPGFMAQYARGFRSASVSGRGADYLATQAGIAREFAERDRVDSGRCSVGAVRLTGSRAVAVLTWHYSNRHTGANAYTYTRDYTERSVWSRAGSGWREEGAQMQRDTLTYQR